MVKNKELLKFVEEMEKVMEEKAGEKGIWRQQTLENLKLELEKQVKNLIFHSTYNDRAKRSLIHIANYCFFLYENIDKGVESGGVTYNRRTRPY